MLWTLHNRASESLRPDGWLHDADAERIYGSIAYDFERSFGRPDGSHATRSVQFDEVVSAWMQRHPGGCVVELGCGLETQWQRIGNDQLDWLCVDVPEAIAIRERYLQAQGRCRHLPLSALDPRWLDAIRPEAVERGVFITAQGLLMYFEPDEVRRLLQTIAARLPAAELMFDTIPPWFSRKTTSSRGLWRTRHYRTPPMPWGIAPSQIEPCLRAWLPGLADLSLQPYRRFRGFPASLMPWLGRLPGLSNALPLMVHLRLGQDRTATRPPEP